MSNEMPFGQLFSTKGSLKNKLAELALRFRLDSESHKFAYLAVPIE